MGDAVDLVVAPSDLVVAPRHGRCLDLAPDLYHADPALGSTDVSTAARSVAHFRASKIDRVAREETASMRLGSMVHTLTLEPEFFPSRYAVAPEGVDRRTKAGKAILDAFEAEAAGRIVIDSDEAFIAAAIAASVHRHPWAGRILRRAESIESSWFGVDEPTGLRIKARPDAMVGGTLIDLKTTSDASRREWQSSAYRYGYHRQAIHYSAAVEAAGGPEVDAIVFVVVETKPPYAVAVYELDEEFLDLGERQRRRALDRIARAASTDTWVGYNGDAPTTIGPPRWAKYDDEEDPT